MNNEECLLNDIYQNARMGMQSIPQLMEETTDDSFKNSLREQQSEFQKIAASAEGMMTEKEVKPKEISAMSKFSAYMMTEMKTMTDKSTSKMAEMMIQGNTMGMTKIIRNMREHQEADATASSLAKKLLKTTENNIKSMKDYL